MLFSTSGSFGCWVAANVTRCLVETTLAMSSDATRLQKCFETCIANAYRIARSDVSYKESLFLTDSDSDSDSESSADSSSDSDSREVEEIQGQALQMTIAPVSPVKVNPSPMIPQYVSPLGYGVPEPRRQPPNLIEPARPDWTATNPVIIAKTPETTSIDVRGQWLL